MRASAHLGPSRWRTFATCVSVTVYREHDRHLGTLSSGGCSPRRPVTVFFCSFSISGNAPAIQPLCRTGATSLGTALNGGSRALWEGTTPAAAPGGGCGLRWVRDRRNSPENYAGQVLGVSFSQRPGCDRLLRAPIRDRLSATRPAIRTTHRKRAARTPSLAYSCAMAINDRLRVLQADQAADRTGGSSQPTQQVSDILQPDGQLRAVDLKPRLARDFCFSALE